MSKIYYPDLLWLKKQLHKLGVKFPHEDASFSVESNESLACTEITSPTPLTTLSQIKEINGFEIDVSTASVKNVTGRSLTMTGSMAIQIEQTGGQPATLYIASQISDDKINWSYNPKSLRVVEIFKNGIDYITIPSLNIANWNDGQYIRWVFAKDGNGGVLLSQPTQTLGSEVVPGQTFVWTMRERIKP